MDRRAWQATVHGVARVGHNLATKLPPISLKIDWFDLRAVQGTLKSLLQYHSSKASLLRRLSAFYMVHLSHPHITSGKTVAWTRWTFVSKVISPFFI